MGIMKLAMNFKPLLKRKFLLLCIAITCSFLSHAQDTLSRHRIAIFAPLYLDSAFNDTSGYRYAKNVFPKFINPGIEFYEGVQLALDSMNTERVPLEVYVFDTRATDKSLQDQ
jgi:hypothetical protein